jgi:hypothetical protein
MSSATLYAILIIFNGATVEANKTHKICNINRQNEHVCGGGVRRQAAV